MTRYDHTLRFLALRERRALYAALAAWRRRLLVRYPVNQTDYAELYRRHMELL